MINKALLIQSSNGHPTPPRQYPYGLAIISSILKQKDVNTFCFDGNLLNKKSLEEILRHENFDFIGISGIITSFAYQKEISNLIKKLQREAIVASGGGLISSVGPRLFEFIPDLDVGFIGEGEIILNRFLEEVESLKYLNDININNVVTPRNSVNYNPKKRDALRNLDDIPFPEFEGWHIENYLENPVFPLTPNLESSKRRVSTIISRGCPYSCDYCGNTIQRREIRFRSIDNLFCEINLLVNKYGVDYIFFNDETFLVNHKSTREFLKKYHQGGYSFKWSISTRSDLVHPEILKELAKANCDFIYYGFESGSQKILDAMKKGFTVEDNYDAFINTIEAGIYCAPNLIIGYDNETDETMIETYNFIKKLEDAGKKIRNNKKRTIFQQSLNNFGKIYVATPYPGTPFYERVKNKISYDLKTCLDKISFKDAYYLTINASNFSDEKLEKFRDDLTNYVINLKL